MVKSERERLAWAVDVLRDWKREYGSGEVDHVFVHLNGLDQSRNADLWQGVREALATNEAFQNTEVQQHFHIQGLAEEGQWWRDPANWTTEAAEVG